MVPFQNNTGPCKLEFPRKRGDVLWEKLCGVQVNPFPRIKWGWSRLVVANGTSLIVDPHTNGDGPVSPGNISSARMGSPHKWG